MLKNIKIIKTNKKPQKYICGYNENKNFLKWYAKINHFSIHVKKNNVKKY